MTDCRDPDNDAKAKRKELVDLFLQRTHDDVEKMRRSVSALIANETAAWQELRFHSRRIAGQADSLELGVLGACAHELARLADERFTLAVLDANFMLTVSSAIEVVSIELRELLREQG